MLDYPIQAVNSDAGNRVNHLRSCYFAAVDSLVDAGARLDGPDVLNEVIDAFRAVCAACEDVHNELVHAGRLIEELTDMSWRAYYLAQLPGVDLMELSLT